MPNICLIFKVRRFELSVFYLCNILLLFLEQLTSSLRLSVPGVQAQVFLCFRVILLRMTPLHVTSLWPIIISEMLQVFLQIEQELATDTEEFRFVEIYYY